MKILRFARTAGLLLGLSLTANSQQQTIQSNFQARRDTTTLSGRVFDRNGAVIVGAEVSILGRVEVRFEAHTNTEGVYSVDLPPGFYHIAIWANGFLQSNYDCYQVPSGSAITLDVTLTVSGERGCTPESPRGKGLPSRQKAKTSIKRIIE